MVLPWPSTSIAPPSSRCPRTCSASRWSASSLPLGLATFLASLLSPWLAALPAAALALLLHGITAAIQHISHAQAADLRVPGPTLAHALARRSPASPSAAGRSAARRAFAFAAIAAARHSPPPSPSGPRRPPSIPTSSKSPPSTSARATPCSSSRPPAAPCSSTREAPPAQPPTPKTPPASAPKTPAFDVGEEVVSPYLWSRQFRRLDVVALTHAHSDHMGGMPAVLRNFRPRELWVAVDPNSAALPRSACGGRRTRHQRPPPPRRRPHGLERRRHLRPRAHARLRQPRPPVNNDSLVMRMQFGQASALLEGDAEAPSEHAMADRRPLSRSAPIGPDTLLKVGHHGSRTSTTPEFLALAAPRDAVISVGAQNTFGHPAPGDPRPPRRRPRPPLPHRPVRPHHLPALPRRPHRRAHWRV